jgi:hypothetical protein
MLIRDLPHGLMKKLAGDADREFDEWWKMTGGKEFGSNKSLDSEKVFQYAFSKGVSAILRRIDEVVKQR